MRTAIEALAGVLGGTQSLHTNALDEVLALPSEHAALVALRTQQVIAEETGVANVIDPLGGSWYVEWLTDEIERRCEEEFAAILERSEDGTITSGILRGIEEGYFSSEIADAAFAFQRRLDDGNFRMVGVNSYVDDDADRLETLRISAEVERVQVQRLTESRSGRDEAALQAALDRRQVAATSEENLVPLIMDAVRADATVGEVSSTLQVVFGTYQESPRL